MILQDTNKELLKVLSSFSKPQTPAKKSKNTARLHILNIKTILGGVQ